MSLRGWGREKNCSKSSERNLAKNSFLEGLFSPALPVPLGLRNSQMVLVVWYSWAPSKLQLEKQKKRKQVYFRGTLQNTIKGVMHTLKVKKDILWNIHCEYYCEEYFSRILESTSLTFDIMLQVLNLYGKSPCNTLEGFAKLKFASSSSLTLHFLRPHF